MNKEKKTENKYEIIQQRHIHNSKTHKGTMIIDIHWTH